MKFVKCYLGVEQCGQCVDGGEQWCVQKQQCQGIGCCYGGIGLVEVVGYLEYQFDGVKYYNI